MSEKPTYEDLEQRVRELEAAEYNHRNALKELRQSEEKFRILFENTTQELHLWELVRDEFNTIKTWKLVDINPAGLKAWSKTRPEIIGKTADDIFPDFSATTHFMPFVQKITAEGIPHTRNFYFSTTGQHLQMTCVPYGEYFIITGVDITDRKRADELLVRDLDAMTRLQQLGTLSVQDGKLEPILTAVVDTAIAISGADFGNIQMLDPASGDLRIVAHRFFPTWWVDYWNSANKDMGVCDTALEFGERIIVEDVEKSPIFLGKPSLDIQRKVGVRAVQSTPLFSRSGKIVGMFSTHYRMPGRPDELALRLLDLLARQAADIIEHVQNQAALRESEQYHKNLVETANSAIVRWKPDGEIIYINNFGLTIFGYIQEELIGKHVMILVPNKESTGIDISCLAKHIAENPEHYTLNVNENVKKNGERFWMVWTNKAIIDEKGNIKEILAIGNDINNRMQAEEALVKIKTLFQTTFMSSPVALSLTSLKENICIDINQAEADMFGYTRDECIGKIRPSVLWYDMNDGEKFIGKLLQTGKLKNECVRLRHKDGRLIIASVSASLLDLKEDKLVLYAFEDITERKQAEEKIRQNLIEKETLLKEIHHRVKNNLAVISGLISLQSDQIEDNSVKEMLTICKNRIKSMAMIHETLYQTENFSAINFNECIRSIIYELTSTYQPWLIPINIQTFDQEILLDIVKAIPCALIVNELIVNALKYAFTGIEKPVLTAGIQQTDKIYTLTVKDNGNGMADKINFITAETLGLVLVRSLTEQLKGSLQFFTDPSVGHGITAIINFKE